MVYVLLAPGFEEAEALVPVDLLRRANVETATVSLTGEPVPGSHGITVTADLAMDQVDLDRAEMVVLPGGGPGYKNLGADPRVERLVRVREGSLRLGDLPRGQWRRLTPEEREALLR